MSEPIKVQVDPDAINRYVADAVVGSVLGQHVTEAIEKALKPSGTWDRTTPVESAVISEVQQHVRIYIRELIRGEFAPMIREAVLRHLTEERVEEIAVDLIAQLGKVTSEDLGISR